MVFRRNPTSAVVCSVFLLGTPLPVFPQQSNLQIALFPKAIAALEANPSDGDADTYLSSIARRPAAFQPTASDLLIGRAEEEFGSGKLAYQSQDATKARSEFDAAIDLMLQASSGPTDRRLYESKLEQMVDSIHRYDLAGLGAGAPDADVAQFEKAPLDDILQMTFPVDPQIKTKVSAELKSTASDLPLTTNDAVLGYINYFSGRGRRTIIAGLERAARYKPMISRILAEEGVPQELIHLAQAESGFLPRAISNRAAVGMWQFVQFRGREYGLNQTPLTDDRLDPEKATRAAAHHLHDLYNKFGDWYLAIAAYNCGPNAVERAVERTGYADYWELRARHAIPQETSNYVPIILAMTIMTKNAAEYGLNDYNPEPALEYDTVRVGSSTHLALVGDLTDTPVSQLLDLNPALIKSVAPANYELHIPKGTGDELQASLDLFPEAARASWRMHRVQPGETLTAIAHQYATPVASIEGANRIAADGPRAGDRLMIPASYETSASPRTLSRRSSLRRAAFPHRTLARGRSARHSVAAMSAVASRAHRATSHRRA